MHRQLWINLATLGPVGRIRPAPGTWGSLAALLPAAGMAMAGDWLLEIGVVVACIIGVKAADIYEAHSGKKDASEVVIDELAGQWIALLVIPFDWRWWVTAFLLFRLFDIAKPGPVKMAERLPGGIGVMADDVVAGVLVAALLVVVQLLMTGAAG
ncbi:MAG: phosphatidylglycerophosphatase A [Pseudomonadota bacterium]|nr:phosphatidylglycerophosphatase A [Pseudomonadota bacterium]